MTVHRETLMQYTYIAFKRGGEGSLYSFTLWSCNCDVLVRIVTKSPKVGPLLIFSISLVFKYIPIFAVWRIPDPDFLFIPDPGSRIPDLKTATKDRGEKFFFVKPFFVATNFTKTEYYFIFDMLKKKIWPNFPRIFEVFTQKIVSRGQKGTGSRIRIRNTVFF